MIKKHNKGRRVTRTWLMIRTTQFTVLTNDWCMAEKKAHFFPLLSSHRNTRVYFPLPYLLSTVDIMCIDTVTFTLWNLCRLIYDGAYCIEKGMECKNRVWKHFNLNCQRRILSRDWFVWQSSRKKIAMDKNLIYSNCCGFKNERKEVHSNCTFVTFELKKNS